ncbi:MAG: phosphatase domain-containing protein [Candidatus Binatia bacterium]
MPEAATSPRVSIHRWDLDKTYLRTDFDRLRELIRVPFQKAADKIDVPGVVELIRSLRECARRQHREVRIFFISASPPQIGQAIREKFALDGVEIDGIVFKDQLRVLMRGRLKSLREQVGFKLAELLRARASSPDESSEFLFGDDWEADPLIYSVYADLTAGRMDPGDLERVLVSVAVDREWRGEIERLLPAVAKRDVVRRIFINLERQTPPASFRVFGHRLVPTFNYFQTAACLYEEGELDVASVERVGHALIDRDAYTREMLENSLEDVVRRGHLAAEAEERLAQSLRVSGLLPRRALPLRRRMANRLRSWLRARPPLAAPRAVESLDYGSIVEGWRGEP